MKAPSNDLPSDLALAIQACYLTTALRYGLIDARGKSDDELRKEFKSYLLALHSALRNMTDDEIESGRVTDHTNELLKWARTSYRRGAFEFAVLAYALFFEHELNDLMSVLCSRAGIPGSETKEILRHVDFSKGKTTWLPCHQSKA